MSENNELGRALVKSFIAVACGVLVATLGYLLTIALVIVLFFPDHARQMAQSGNNSNEAVEQMPEASIPMAPPLELPASLFAICPIIQAITAWLGGYLAARFAPAGRMGHGVLVAGVLLFNSIQLLLKEESALPGWLISINTVVGPACALWGAAAADKFAPQPTDEEDDERRQNDENES